MSDVGAPGIEPNFYENLANQIVAPESFIAMKNMWKLFGSGRSIVLKPSAAAMRQKQRAVNILKSFDEEAGIRFDDINSSHDLPSINMPGFIEDETRFTHDALAEMSRNIINQITCENMLDSRLGSRTRRDLALRIEQLL